MFKRKVRRLCELMVHVNLLDPDFHEKVGFRSFRMRTMKEGSIIVRNVSGFFIWPGDTVKNHDPDTQRTQDIFSFASFTLENIQEKFHTPLSEGLSENKAVAILQRDELKEISATQVR